MSLLELCQLEVESWLALRSFSLRELSRNGKRVSSSLDSKSESWRGGAERLVVPDLVVSCCLSLSATFCVGFLLLEGF